MKTTITKSFDLAFPIDNVWVFFNDPERLVACLPGATLVESMDDDNHKGLVTLKIGPVKLKYNGLINFEDRNHEQRTLKLVGKGTDVKGKGSANMLMNASVHEVDEGAKIEYTMDISVAGMMAQFGARLITDATHSVFDQFATNVKNKMAGEQVDNSLHASDVIKGMFKKRKDTQS